MPVLSRFYGIVIRMYFLQSEHNPPHIHAIYGEHNGLIDISTLEMIEGDLPSKALELVKEWAGMYRKELMAMWNDKVLQKLPPLK